MGGSEASPRRLRLQAVAGVALIIGGAAAYLWIVFGDLLPSVNPSARLDVWAAVRVAAGIALAAGTWLLALALVHRRRAHEPEPVEEP